MPHTGELPLPTNGPWDWLTPRRSLVSVFIDSGAFLAVPAAGVLALFERVVSFTVQTFVSVKNAIWSLRPRTLLGWVTAWHGEHVPPNKCRCGSVPFQRPWRTAKVRPAPLFSRSPLQRRLLQLRLILPRCSTGAEPGRSSAALPRMDTILCGCLCPGGGCGGYCLPWGIRGGNFVALWAVCGQIVALPNRGVAKSWRCQIVVLPNAGITALRMVGFAAVGRMQVGKCEDLSRAAAPDKKASPGAARLAGVPKARVFAGPRSPLRVPGLGQGSDPIRW